MNPNPFVAQLESVIADCENALNRVPENHDLPVMTSEELQTRCITVLERASGVNSTYAIRARSVKHSYRVVEVSQLVGICKSLLLDIRHGYTHTLEELVHANVFGDYMEMAAYLLEQTWGKDAAAVITGSTLEAHLRKLCDKNNLPLHNDKGKSLMGDMLNANLYKSQVYNNVEQQQVIGWNAIRNKAAHGEYDEYNLEQVRQMHQGILDFMGRHPA